ncbi:hypothetical protein A1OE_116 [Candidatus Endolissoclinum faulkneri L2]|uniref:Uncharacterized protein n=1 Tax=Candidatus Endolissoclinum faulkneri L2 TaxID=1193729 RepID=K7YLG0_9PROT|nr:hypothetical protein A1OE_116 [Candidatus Endolissoclinum faulkneri L2]
MFFQKLTILPIILSIHIYNKCIKLQLFIKIIYSIIFYNLNIKKKIIYLLNNYILFYKIYNLNHSLDNILF